MGHLGYLIKNEIFLFFCKELDESLIDINKEIISFL